MISKKIMPRKFIIPASIIGTSVLVSISIVYPIIREWLTETIYNIGTWILEVIKTPLFVSLMTYFILDAIVRYRRVIGEIDSKLLFYKPIIISLGSENTDKALTRKLECSHELRKLAGDLGAAYNAVFIKWFFSFIRVILREKDLQEAVKELGYLSNSVFHANDEKNDKKSNTIEHIRKLLKIPPRWV